jgi:kinesin family member 11
LLRDSLGGKTKTCIVATLAPSLSALEETINTLEYAMRARNVKNRPELNLRMNQKEMIRDLTKENERLKAALDAARNKHGVYLTNEEFRELQSQQVCTHVHCFYLTNEEIGNSAPACACAISMAYT